MRKYILGITGLLSIAFCLTISSFKPTEKSEKPKQGNITTDSIYMNYINTLYVAVHLKEAGLSFPVFEKAITGFYNLKKSGQLSNKSILTIADFDQSSTKKRLYIIDLDKKEILLNTWVAHGQKSGNDEAINFSNKNDSFTSSLGFYVTGEVYRGIHGRSLKLDGMDLGFNDNARSRSIVVHGAPYVSEGTISALGRLGRSQGCPAVAPEVADKVITTIGDKTVLFINKSVENYSSKYLDEALAANFALDTTTHLMD
ncbi:murein L,D-transpeptidase catalytic domain family protein [Pedobacter frigiditerrae]|uniref:Murein L,D-transpeptidase catalytic domain family protein n=1 Tax=Pedobacter frigiditerrae TaxID=2530452 RepID=A0A4R0MXP3_9SPHI|nr:murein L,D-transpeptidase catalytic domain family protein [Pedobacter frigiditerrae]TCC92061.1 murein L,D-transpeptidase catalytic domain family protein [Pedobacter frigiditerrae]